jgi:hypothetical protein
MIRYFSSCLLLVFIAALSGYPRPTTVELQNHSGQDAVVLAGDRQLDWKKDEVLRLPTNSELLVWKEDGTGRRPWLFLRIGNERLAFILNYVLPKEEQRSIVHRLEMRADHCLYLIQSGVLADQQPDGFPLHPKEANQMPESTAGSMPHR